MSRNIIREFSNLFTSGSKNFTPKAVRQVVKKEEKIFPMTVASIDEKTGISVLTREFCKENGESVFVRIEKLGDGKTNMTLSNKENSDFYWRNKFVKREKSGSILGGDRIKISKCDQWWNHSRSTNMMKDYNQEGLLEHKELKLSGLGGTIHKAVQDRVYDGHNLTSSVKDMYETMPADNKFIKHSLDCYNNYGSFPDGSSTNYTRAVTAREEAIKNAEAEALAVKTTAEKAAQKAAAELAAKEPRINLGKVLGKNFDELIIEESKLADGTIERIFKDPETKDILLKTHDFGIAHKEWIYGSKKADMIYMSQIGKELPYVVARKGNYTQVLTQRFDSGIKRFVSVQDWYYYNKALHGNTSLKWSIVGGTPRNLEGRLALPPNEVEIFTKRYTKPTIEYYFKELPLVFVREEIPCCREDGYISEELSRLIEDAKLNCIDLRDLIRK